MDYYYLNGEERILNGNTFLVTETDIDGKLQFANEDFIKISGYELDELNGIPHSVVRHPDMPKSVFKNMWEVIKKGQVWSGFIKNKVKNSSEYYWVFATIYPITRNNNMCYISCRKKATRDEIESACAEYKIFA